MNQQIYDYDFGTYLLNKNERQRSLWEQRGRDLALSDYNNDEGSEKDDCDIDDVSLAFGNPESFLMLTLQHSFKDEQLSQVDDEQYGCNIFQDDFLSTLNIQQSTPQSRPVQFDDTGSLFGGSFQMENLNCSFSNEQEQIQKQLQEQEDIQKFNGFTNEQPLKKKGLKQIPSFYSQSTQSSTSLSSQFTESLSDLPEQSNDSQLKKSAFFICNQDSLSEESQSDFDDLENNEPDHFDIKINEPETSLPSSTDFGCKICGKNFKKPQSLGGHISKKHPQTSDQYNKKMRTREDRKQERQLLLVVKRYLKKLFPNVHFNKARSLIQQFRLKTKRFMMEQPALSLDEACHMVYNVYQRKLDRSCGSLNLF